MPPQTLEFRRTATFRRAFDALPASQQAAAKKVFAVFRRDIFHPSLKNHIIQKLSSRRRTIIRAVWIQGDLRAVYRRGGNIITALDIGARDIYR